MPLGDNYSAERRLNDNGLLRGHSPKHSVDTGWVTDEDVEHIAERKRAESAFHPPLDNELTYRRVHIADVVSAHQLALERASALGFARYIISATTPSAPGDLAALRADAATVVRRCFARCEAEYARRGWSLPRSINRVHVNERARCELGRWRDSSSSGRWADASTTAPVSQERWCSATHWGPR